MTADDKRIADLVSKVEQARAYVQSCERAVEYGMANRMGRGSADDRVGLYYAECAFEGAQMDLCDELIEEARAMDLERAA